jgi:UDP-glucose 4-epimerase
MQHFLVTGGAGFIGSHLCTRLLADGHCVTVLDDFSTGRRDNLGNLHTTPRFRLIHDSILNEPVVQNLVRECTAVFHLASAVGVKLIMEQPIRSIETIVQGTAVVLQQARRFGRRVLLTSTSEVYGKSTQLPFRENDDCILGPTTKRRWAYAGAKALDEFLALAHWQEAQLPVVVVRLFNTVGPGQTGRYGMVMPRFVQAALRGEPLTVYGDGAQTRCFCHVRDVVEALVLLMQAPAATGQVVNVGSRDEIAILDLARRIVRLLRSSSAIVLQPAEAVYGADGFEDMQRRVPEIGKVRQLVGWEPRHTLDEIIQDVAAGCMASPSTLHLTAADAALADLAPPV